MRSLLPEAAVLVSHALDRIREGDLEAALEQLEAATAAAPDMPEAWGCKALVARRLGLDEVAQQASSRLMAMSLVPGHA